MTPPQTRSTLARRLSSLSLVLLALAALPASAIPILIVADGDGDQGSIGVGMPGDPARSLAASFELSSAFSDVSVSASLTCLECQADFYLMRNAIGAGTDFISNVLAVTTIDTLAGGGFIDRPTSLFSGLNLDIGTYFLVMALTNLDPQSSNIIWSATQSPLVSSATGVANLTHLMAQSGGYNSTTPPLSTFQPYLVGGMPTTLQFSLDASIGDPVSVPEPGTALLLLGGLAGLVAARRRAA